MINSINTISESFDSSTVEAHTPIGTLYATFIEDDSGKCVRVIIQIGKSGTDTRAWSEALGSMINKLLSMNIPIVTIADSLSAYNSDRLAYNNSRTVRSGPDGIVYAIHSYMESKRVANVTRPYLDMPWL